MSTKHKLLTVTLTQKPDKMSLRQFRRQSVIIPYTSDIQHESAKDNVVFDALSCVAEVKIPTTVDFLAIEEGRRSFSEPQDQL